MGYVATETGRRVRVARTEAGLSQERLAALSGVTTRTVARVENGEETTVGTLASIADALGIALGDLVAEPAAS